MRPVRGKWQAGVLRRNAYQGDVPVWSDDGGKTYNYSTGVYVPGLDECNIAQAANGSLFLISRNCHEGNLDKCQMLRESRFDSNAVRDMGIGNHHFVYSI